MQEQDEENLDMVVQNIENMRSQMLETIKDKQLGPNSTENLQKELADIQHIIEPARFIERHFPDQV